MGVSMKAVREDVTDVIAKLESMKRKAEEPKKDRYGTITRKQRFGKDVGSEETKTDTLCP